MFPVWAKIDHEFDQLRIKNELLSNNIFSKSMIATTNYVNGKSIWDQDKNFFSEDEFQNHQRIPHYKIENNEKVLVPGEINTFNMLNLTELPDKPKSSLDSWEGSLKNNDRIPLWIKYSHESWNWRSDLDIPYTKEVINSLPIEYVLTVRCIIQSPPSIGVVHRDSGPITNQEFFKKGYGSITLNISDGGANLYFINHKNQQKFRVNESKHKAWHFDDSCIHCTSEVQSERIQLRVFAKLKKPYFTFLKHQDMVF